MAIRPALPVGAQPVSTFEVVKRPVKATRPRGDPGRVLQRIGDDDVMQLDNQRTRRQIPLAGEPAWP